MCDCQYWCLIFGGNLSKWKKDFAALFPTHCTEVLFWFLTELGNEPGGEQSLENLNIVRTKDISVAALCCFVLIFDRTWMWTRQWTISWVVMTRVRWRMMTVRTRTCRTTWFRSWTVGCTQSTPASSLTPTPCTMRTCLGTPHSEVGRPAPVPG